MFTKSTTPTVTLQTFCVDLSATDRRAELIGAFHHSETLAGHLFDTVENFQARYAYFCTAPV
jgi:hypothetical protein